LHINRLFQWTDRDELLAFIAQRAFAQIIIAGSDGPLIANAPVEVTAEGQLRFHLSRANPVAKQIDGAVALINIAGPDAYISPDWYGSDDQVPTWNYISIEARGRVQRKPNEDLATHLDALSAVQEERLLPKPVWTSGKMSPGLFDGMMKAIVCFEMTLDEICGSRKLGQNKNADDFGGAFTELTANGRGDMAELMRQAR
jgi:transcriptional regulator